MPDTTYWFSAVGDWAAAALTIPRNERHTAATTLTLCISPSQAAVPTALWRIACFWTRRQLDVGWVAMDDFDLLASSLRADARDIDGFFPALAARLEGAMPPGRARVQRRSKSLFNREKVVHAIEVDMGDKTYACSRGGAGGVQASCKTVVR